MTRFSYMRGFTNLRIENARVGMPSAGLEPAILAGGGFQSRCVYQFRHEGCDYTLYLDCCHVPPPRALRVVGCLRADRVLPLTAARFGSAYQFPSTGWIRCRVRDRESRLRMRTLR